MTWSQLPNSSDEFIWQLFKGRCIVCFRPARDINEIVLRSRSKNSLQDWKNRVCICRECHTEYHHGGVTPQKQKDMIQYRSRFLKAIGREEYI